MAFGEEYTSTDVHFIAGGRTLGFIKQYEAERADPDAVLAAIAAEYGGLQAVGSFHKAAMIFAQPVDNPLFVKPMSHTFKGNSVRYYEVDKSLPEGAALTARINDVPTFELGFHRFARRLTGTENTKTNPDNLRETDAYFNSPYRVGGEAVSAYYRKYGETYVVSVPRVVRGIFNESSAKLSAEEEAPQAAGHTFEWFTPKDCQQIPYSKVVALREESLGDQLTASKVMKRVYAYPPNNR